MHLETERLVLEEFTMDDLPALWDIFRDEQTMEHMAPMTRAGTEELLRSFCLERTPPGAFAARLREGGGLAGWLTRSAHLQPHRNSPCLSARQHTGKYIEAGKSLRNACRPKGIRRHTSRRG